MLLVRKKNSKLTNVQSWAIAGVVALTSSIHGFKLESCVLDEFCLAIYITYCDTPSCLIGHYIVQAEKGQKMDFGVVEKAIALINSMNTKG